MDAFLIDRNVGRLVKWLRAFGFDAEFADDGDDAEIVRRAIHERRAIVTKDRGLLQRRPIARGEVPAVLISADRLGDQLREFFTVVPPCAERLFSRCMRCNVLLRAAAKDDVHEDVPEFVYHQHQEFSRCPSCGRVYWQGTHWAHMAEVLRETLPG